MGFYISMIKPECRFVGFLECMVSVENRIVFINTLMKMSKNVTCKLVSHFVYLLICWLFLFSHRHTHTRKPRVDDADIARLLTIVGIYSSNKVCVRIYDLDLILNFFECNPAPAVKSMSPLI